MAGAVAGPSYPVVYLVMKAKERWTMPVQDWPPALYHLSLVFPGQVPL